MSRTAKSKAADRRQSIQSVEVGLRILDALATFAVPVALKDIARAVDMPPSQVHRYLRSFTNGGIAEQDPASGHYALGKMAVRIGLAALQRLDGLEAGINALRRLTTKWDYAGGLAVWSERGPVMIRWFQGESFYVPSGGVGVVFPVLGSAAGRVFLAYLPKTMTAKLVRQEQRRPVYRYAEADAANVEEIRKSVRRDGYCVIVNHFTPRIRGLAAPILDLQGEPVAVLSIAGRLNEDPDHDPVLEDLKRTAAAISNELGYRQS
jgi:DNA-binding IclR family transcriptional regulator